MAWMIREDKLDPDQKHFINDESKKPGNIWVKGFAGSGKSVLLIHSLKDILHKQPDAKVAIVVYTHSLIDMFKTGMKEINLPSSIPVMTYYDFVDSNTSYDYIFCDEVQDLPSRVLFAMKTRGGKIIVAGDSNQSIYDKDPKWNDEVVNPNQVGDIINARPFPLQTIHRLTRSIISAVQKLLPNINIFGAKRDSTKQDVNVRLCEATNESEEVKYIFQEGLKGTAVADSCAVLFHTHKSIIHFVSLLLAANNKPDWQFKPISWDREKPKDKQRPDYDDLNNHLEINDLKIQYIGNNHGSLKDAESKKHLILMTYHSAKGLDFDNVFLPFLNANFYLHPNKAKTLFMVAMTRSRKNLYLTYSGYTHDLVDTFKGECSEISISDFLKHQSTTKQSNTFDY